VRVCAPGARDLFLGEREKALSETEKALSEREKPLSESLSEREPSRAARCAPSVF